MGGSSKQTIGYKYFGGMMVVIGNRIEKLLNINADNRGWMLKSDTPNDNSTITINEPNLFGGSNQEGGWVGLIDTHLGADDQEQNKYLARHIDKDVSAYPNLSYLVFRGADLDGVNYKENLDKGFELVSMSGMLKDFMLWVKRTRIKNDGSRQWYEINEDGEIVCEIEATYGGAVVKPTPLNEVYGSVNCNYYNSPAGTINSSQYKTFNEVILKDDVWGNLDQLEYSNIEFVSLNEDIPYIVRFIFKVPEGGGGFVFVVDARMASVGIRDMRPELFYGETPDPEVKIEKVFIENIKTVRFFITVKTRPRDFNFFVKCNLYPDDDGTYFFNYRVELAGIYQIPINPSYENPAFDINPIHKIREILTDYTAMGKPENSINDGNFKIAADRIFSEKLGISWCIQEKSCKEALDELLYHIEAGLRINRQSGLYEVILFRDDLIYSNDALVFNESNISTINFDIANLDESVSSINISYYDRDLIKDSSFLLYENGLERTRGFSVSENIDFPYFMNRQNAEIVGNWKLKQLCSPTWKGNFKTGISDARKLNKYDVVKLSWKSKNIVDLQVRVMNINLGDGIDNTVSIDFVEVIPYSNIDYTSTSVDTPTDIKLPPQKNENIAFEMPYFEAIQRFTQTQVDLELGNSPEIGYLMASAAKPQSNSLNAFLFTDNATGSFLNMSRSAVVDYCPAIKLDQAIRYMDNVIKIKNLDYVENSGVPDFSGATAGTWLILNNEIMVYESFNNLTREITVKRGALDTSPEKHDSGIIFFSDEFSGVDQNQYIFGETVKYQVLTTTPSGMQDLNVGLSKDVELKSRAIRPYPPANVKVNGEYYPANIEGDLFLTWVDRNRIQQTGGNIIGWIDGGVTIEQNTQYQIVLTEIDEDDVDIITQSINVGTLNTYTFSASSMQTNTAKINIVLKTIRDGFECLYPFTYKVDLSTFFTAPYNLSGVYSE